MPLALPSLLALQGTDVPLAFLLLLPTQLWSMSGSNRTSLALLLFVFLLHLSGSSLGRGKQLELLELPGTADRKQYLLNEEDNLLMGKVKRDEAHNAVGEVF